MNGGFALSCPVPFTATDTIEIGHGGGGMMTRRLVEGLFRPAFGAGEDELVHDGALLDAGGAGLAFTTDSYVVSRCSSRAGTSGRSRSTARSMTLPCAAPSRWR